MQHLAHGGVFVLLLGAGYVLPVPAEVVLLTAGYATHLALADTYATVSLALLGLFVGDLAMFVSIKKGSAFAARIAGSHTESGFAKYSGLFARNATAFILFSRFLGAFRIMIPSIAVASKMKTGAFALLNAVSLVPYAVFFILIGRHFHRILPEVVTETEILMHVVFFLSLALVGFALRHVAARRLVTR